MATLLNQFFHCLDHGLTELSSKLGLRALFGFPGSHTEAVVGISGRLVSQAGWFLCRFSPAKPWRPPGGVSADNSLIVGGTNGAAGPKAFVWDATHGTQDLEQILTLDGINMTGWTLEPATGISADGTTIVGKGVDPSGASEAWIATSTQGWFAPIPEPNTGLLVMVGVLGLAVIRRRAGVSA